MYDKKSPSVLEGGNAYDKVRFLYVNCFDALDNSCNKSMRKAA